MACNGCFRTLSGHSPGASGHPNPDVRFPGQSGRSVRSLGMAVFSQFRSFNGVLAGHAEGLESTKAVIQATRRERPLLDRNTDIPGDATQPPELARGHYDHGA